MTPLTNENQDVPDEPRPGSSWEDFSDQDMDQVRASRAKGRSLARLFPTLLSRRKKDR